MAGIVIEAVISFAVWTIVRAIYLNVWFSDIVEKMSSDDKIKFSTNLVIMDCIVFSILSILSAIFVII